MSHPVTIDALRKFAETFVEQEAGRLGTDGWWQTPLLATAALVDPATGEVRRELTQKMTGPMGHDRCYRNRITELWYINTATGGSDFLALDGSGEFPNPWVRSTCRRTLSTNSRSAGGW